MEIFLVLIAAVLLLFWLAELLSLMMMTDDEFPGRLLPIVGAILFAIWKRMFQTQREANAVADDVTDLIERSRADTDAT